MWFPWVHRSGTEKECVTECRSPRPCPIFHRKRRLITATFPAGSFKFLFTWTNWVKLSLNLSFTGNFFPFEKFSVTRPNKRKQLKASLSHDETILAMWNAQRSTWKLLQLHVQGRECLRIVVIIRSVVISRFYRSSDNLHRHDFFFGAITRRSSTQWMTEMHGDVTMGSYSHLELESCSRFKEENRNEKDPMLIGFRAVDDARSQSFQKVDAEVDKNSHLSLLGNVHTRCEKSSPFSWKFEEKKLRDTPTKGNNRVLAFVIASWNFYSHQSVCFACARATNNWLCRAIIG